MGNSPTLFFFSDALQERRKALSFSTMYGALCTYIVGKPCQSVRPSTTTSSPAFTPFAAKKREKREKRTKKMKSASALPSYTHSRCEPMLSINIPKYRNHTISLLITPYYSVLSTCATSPVTAFARSSFTVWTEYVHRFAPESVT